MALKNPFPVVMSTVALDAIGFGLIMPVLPDLLRGLAHSDHVAGHYGVLLALYALMQFCFAPMLGALSDRFGRRPVLLVSLAGAAIDYAIMASAPVLWVLYVGRIVAGVTGATGAVAGACIADITGESERARRFGQMSAMFGVGMILGPVLGGLAGSFSAHAPFAVAAVLNGVNFLVALWCLPETRRAAPERVSIGAINPLAGFRRISAFKAAAALLSVYFIMQMVGQVPVSLWVIYGEDRFGWNAAQLGLSLAAFGALHAVAQGFVTGPLTDRLGERSALSIGMAADALGCVLLAFATRGWMVAPVMVLLATGGIGAPALQAMLANQVGEDRQGELQGLLSSLNSLTAIVGPLGFTALYAFSAPGWNGWVWVLGASLYLLCLPALARLSPREA